MRAIELNGTAVEDNLSAFAWGRLAVHDPGAVERVAGPLDPRPAADTLDRRIARRTAYLGRYQDAARGRRYADLLAAVAEAESRLGGDRDELSAAVCESYFRLLAYKDEYEVARLWLQDPLWEEVRTRYDGALTRHLHLHPPQLRALGLERKLKLGGWAHNLFGLLHRVEDAGIHDHPVVLAGPNLLRVL